MMLLAWLMALACIHWSVCMCFLLPPVASFWLATNSLWCMTRVVQDFACWMEFIARCGLLVLFVLVIFALFEVRYDTLRRREKSVLPVNARATASFRLWCSLVIPCALLLMPVLPGVGRWVISEMLVCSTIRWFPVATYFCSDHFCAFFWKFVFWIFLFFYSLILCLGFYCLCMCHRAHCAVIIGLLF